MTMNKNIFSKSEFWSTKIGLVFLLSLWSHCLHAYDFEVDGIYYDVISLTDFTCKVVKGQYTEGDVVIPATVNYNAQQLNVVEIGDNAFKNCYYTNITIPNTVTKIGNYAFSGCYFTNFTIPNSVTSIGSSAFADCRNLTSITIPNSVTNIGSFAFSGCWGLTSITIPNSVTEIQSHTFYQCSSLTSISLPNSIITIGRGAFQECRSLTSVTIPNSVVELGTNFGGSSDGAFASCTSLTSVTIPNSVTSIADYTFAECPNLKTVTSYIENAYYLSFTVFSIINKDGMISSADSIAATLYVPENSVDNYKKADGWKMFTTIEAIPGHSFVDDNGVVYKCHDDYDAMIAYVGQNQSKDLSGVIKIKKQVSYEGKIYNVVRISNNAFKDCNNITSIEIPEGIEFIGTHSFDGCSSLTSLTIPNSVTTIGEYAFQNCSGLTNVTVSEAVTSINKSLFSGCSSLTSITIPNSVTAIGESTFFGCSSLTNITIPSSVTTIGGSAFAGCSSLASITIPNSVTNISWRAFLNCSNLTNITIPSSVTAIGGSAFAGCSSLTSITIPNSVTAIGENAFEGCSSLASITIPNSVTRIQSYTFYDCSSLASITTPNSVTEIGQAAFSGCSSLTSITIPNSVTNISWGAFSGCSSLTGITIPNSVTAIGENAFEGCSSLTSITIPNSVTEIGGRAFWGCDRLISITSDIYPFPIMGNVYNEDVYNYATLYVPAQFLQLYQTTDGWNKFKNIVPVGIYEIFTLCVTDEQGSDITEKVSITWYNADEKPIGTGNSLSGIADSTEVYYTVSLDEELGRVYREVKMQKFTADEDTITCRLEKIGQVTLTGRVSATDIDKAAAMVSVKQMLNGKYEEAFTTQTNEQGEFSVTIFDDETDITISRDGCIDATLHRDGFGGNGNIGTVPLSLISGHVATANVTYYPAVAAGEAAEETAWGDGLNNMELTLTNKTKGSDLTDFTIQNGNLIIKSGAEAGDEISLTAKSRQGFFADAATTFTIAEGANAFTLQLTELGGLDATCEGSSNDGTTGYLYDGNDMLVGRGSYVGETLSMRHVPDGVYTLVSMGRSLLLGNMTRLADMAAVGLTEGEDYVATRVEIADGWLTAVSVSEVPRLNETQFYYTTGNTYFNASKASVTVGNYLTLSAHVDLKPEYAAKVDDVTLIIDLPEGCQMVENSAIANRQGVMHSVSGNRITMQLSKEQWQSEVRFCVMPTLNQTNTITAMASFDFDGQVQQPIGTARFDVKGLSLSAPQFTVHTNITINGTANGHSEVSVYDNDVFVGKTTSKADGSWTTQAELYKPYSHSFHDIYAKIVTTDGLELMSETQQVEYDKNVIAPEKVTMLYYNPECNTDYNIVFNLVEGTTTPSFYNYFPYKDWPYYYETYETEPKDFTFLADFNFNDTTQIKNVNIKVLNSDGTVRTLPAIFDGKRNQWVASTMYSSASRLPQNAMVEYDLIPTEDPFDPTRIIDDNNQFINLIKNYVTNADSTKCEVMDANESMTVCKYQTYTMDEPVFIRMEILDYDQWIDELESKDYFSIDGDGVITNVVDSVLEGRNLEWIWNNEDRTMVYVETSISDETIGESPNISRKQITKAPSLSDIAQGVGRYLGNRLKDNILNLFCNAGDIMNIINDYNAGYSELQDWWIKCNQTTNDHMKLHDRTLQFVEAKCPDGTLKLSPIAYSAAKRNLQECLNDAYSMRQQFQKNLNRVDRDLVRKRNFASQLSACVALVGVAKGLRETATTVRDVIKGFARDVLLPSPEEVAAEVYEHLLRNEFYTVDMLNAWYYPASMDIINKYTDLQTSIKNSYGKCEKEKDEEDEEQEEKKDEPIDEKSENKPDFRGNGTTPILDPSGYVYEAVMSNRLEGVTATCYQQVQGGNVDGNATEDAVIWNAEDYSQQNPLKTDKTGFYRWDVPQGMWQVKYEKEGYETAYSEWLPVPPPQLDVNIGMKQSTPPTVEKMRGYESGITVAMAKYMRPETMTAQNITVTRNGMAEKGSIELLNAEKAPLSGETYVSKVRFVPEVRFNTTDLVVVTVHQAVESYCGVKMGKDHVETVKIEPEVTDIVADSIITVAYQGEKELRVAVLPKDAAAGKTLRAVSSSPMIASVGASETTIGQDGVAVLTLSGELPGGAVLSLSVDGTDVAATSKVRVAIVNENAVADPVASIRSGETIYNDDLVALSCETEGATIYYTLDGSCPCDEQARIEYTGPITLPAGQVTLKAMAVREGMEDSDIVVYKYTVEDRTGVRAVKGEHQVKAWYQDGCIVIAGAKGAGCHIYDLQGRELAERSGLESQSRVKVPQADVYVVSVSLGDGQTVVCKVLAR